VRGHLHGQEDPIKLGVLDNEVLRAGEGRLEDRGRQRAGADFPHRPLAGADADQLALFRQVGDGHADLVP
jgi:hypothetical protein